jgi:hypothetical protein
MNQKDHAIYKDFLIWAITYTLAESGEWRGKVNIMRKDGNKIRPFLLESTFKTEEDAIRHSLECGKQIIDGKIPACHLEDI